MTQESFPEITGRSESSGKTITMTEPEIVQMKESIIEEKQPVPDWRTASGAVSPNAISKKKRNVYAPASA